MRASGCVCQRLRDGVQAVMDDLVEVLGEVDGVVVVL